MPTGARLSTVLGGRMKNMIMTIHSFTIRSGQPGQRYVDAVFRITTDKTQEMVQVTVLGQSDVDSLEAVKAEVIRRAQSLLELFLSEPETTNRIIRELFASDPP